jgi:hypothetical protein
LPWEVSNEFAETLKGVAEAPIWFANSFRVRARQINTDTQGVALGWNLRTPSAFPIFADYMIALERPGYHQSSLRGVKT